MQKNGSKTRMLAYTALVAAVYAVLTVGVAPLSYGMIQIRFSEILVLLAFVDKRYAPGLILGCFIANCFSPLGMVDAIFGTCLYSSGTLQGIIPFQQKLVYLQAFGLYSACIFWVWNTICCKTHHCS